MQHHALDERQDLGATLRTLGPSAATLCAGWTTSELAAHIALRERSLAETAGRLPVRRLHEIAARQVAGLVAREPYERIVAMIESGPPRYSPWALPPLREAVNLLEYVVHHEDARRGGGDLTPRPLPIARQRAVWQRLRLAAPLTLARVGVGVVAVWPSHGQFRTLAARRGGPVVTITGDPVELALVAFGRQSAAAVDYDGAPSDIEVVSGAHIAL